MVSDDFPSAFLSLSPEDDDDDAAAGLDIDLDAMETPSDSESLPFPIYDLEGNVQLSRRPCGTSLTAAPTSRRPAAPGRCLAASERRALRPQVQVGFPGRFWLWIRSRPVWTGSSGAGGHGGQTGHQMALFLPW